MKDYKNYEDDICLSDMLLHCLSHWKSILMCILAGIVVSCTYTYLVSIRAENMNSTMSEEITLAEQNVDLYLDKVTYLEKHLKESGIMQMDPYRLYQGTISYIITLPQNEWEGVSNLLYVFVRYGGLFKHLEDIITQYSSAELSHLVMIPKPLTDKGLLSADASAPVACSISLSVYGATEEEAGQLLTSVSEKFIKYIDSLKMYYAIESVAVMDQVIIQADSSELTRYQEDVRTELKNEQTNYKNSIADLEDLKGEEVSAMTYLKNIFIGGFISGVLIFVLWCLMYIFGGRLYSVSDPETKYDIKLLGNVYQKQARGIAGWIAKKRWGPYAAFPLQYQEEVVLTNTKYILNKKRDIKHLLITGSLNEDISDAAAFFKTSLETDGYAVDVFGNIMAQFDILKNTGFYDGVLVLESMEKSRIALVNEEIKILREHIGDLIGLITYE